VYAGLFGLGLYGADQNKRGYFVSRLVTSEILNRTAPNLALIKVTSYWASCRHLY